MPRRNRPPRSGGREPAQPLGGAVGWARTQSAVDGDWLVRSVPGFQGRKTYRCPGCDHEIPPGVSHLVAWPDDADGIDTPEQRRHWHTPCWSARDTRRPTARPRR